jgi:hypothetical protein
MTIMATPTTDVWAAHIDALKARTYIISYYYGQTNV